jgi:hypothetical protein
VRDASPSQFAAGNEVDNATRFERSGPG